MPPIVALGLTLLFIAFLLVEEGRHGYRPSAATWIPTVWMLIIGSRSLTEWVSLGTPLSMNIEEGSPLDRNAFFLLMVAGVIVLIRRSIAWSWVVRNNMWLLLFFLYCGISVLWSDIPEVAFKRWFKALGDPIMVMIILTDPNPVKAVEILINRCAYVLISLSVVFIKYYPQYGRQFSEWTGEAMNTGVTTNKNLLGYLLFVCGIFFVYRLLKKVGKERLPAGSRDVVVLAVFLVMIGWLFSLADAKTAVVCSGIGTGLALALGFKSVQKHLGRYLLVALAVFIVFHVWLGITEMLVSSLGRNMTLTGRTDLWPVVLGMAGNPVLGVGFESFWLGERLRTLQAMWYFKPNQAHNGYIEIYLNLGWAGLLLLAGMVISSYIALRKTLARSLGAGRIELADFSRIGIGYLIAYLVFNFTDASFKSLNVLFVVFLLFAIRCPERSLVASHTDRTRMAGIHRIDSATQAHVQVVYRGL